jgi:hypothetical protein
MKQDKFITNPIEAFELGVYRASGLFDKYRMGLKAKQPGAVVFDMEGDVRELLKELKSDDIANIRPDAIFGTPEQIKACDEANKYWQRIRDELRS